MNKKLYIVITFVTLFSFATRSYAQSRTDSLENIKKVIIEHSTVSSPGVGLFFSPSHYWYAFGYLAYLAASEELESMTNDTNAALRTYSFVGLTYNGYSKIKAIRKKFLNDNAPVKTFFGCISGLEMNISNCIKHFMKNKSYKTEFVRLLNSLETDISYRNKLYDDLITNKKVSGPPHLE